ncbi:hypothetical protein FQA47_002936 [Oryzias melastigma]|uniref:Uncharacterized protein n=1 Tax=Oryzias melastigma TaxID=30732 RepID=A0A834F428_ORYME|nr:hypothetical protein FQA47_002936 [Oryzias melastigma]
MSALTCALLPFASALPAVGIRRTRLRHAQQQSQQPGARQVPDPPSGPTPPRTRRHDPTSARAGKDLSSGEPWKEERTVRLLPPCPAEGGSQAEVERGKLCATLRGRGRTRSSGFRVQEASQPLRFVRAGSSGSILPLRRAARLRVQMKEKPRTRLTDPRGAGAVPDESNSSGGGDTTKESRTGEESASAEGWSRGRMLLSTSTPLKRARSHLSDHAR